MLVLGLKLVGQVISSVAQHYLEYYKPKTS